MEITIREYLSEALALPVFLELPEKPEHRLPRRFVLIEKVGGRKANHVRTESFALQSYSLNSLFEAATLDAEVCEAMDNIISLPEIGASRMTSNYSFTDTRTKKYRYQSVYDITFVKYQEE